MELKPIEKRKLEMYEKLKASWYFERWYEKLILVVMAVLSVWKILNLIVGAV